MIGEKSKVGRPRKIKTTELVDGIEDEEPVPTTSSTKKKRSSDRQESGELGCFNSNVNKFIITSSLGKLCTMYTHAQKVKVAEYARHHGVRATAKHYGTHHKNVQRWLKTLTKYQ